MIFSILKKLYDALMRPVAFPKWHFLIAGSLIASPDLTTMNFRRLWCIFSIKTYKKHSPHTTDFQLTYLIWRNFQKKIDDNQLMIIIMVLNLETDLIELIITIIKHEVD